MCAPGMQRLIREALLPFASGSGSAPIVRLLEQLPDGAAAPQQPPVFLEWQAWDAERLKEYKTLLLLALTEFHARVGHVPARRWKQQMLRKRPD